MKNFFEIFFLLCYGLIIPWCVKTFPLDDAELVVSTLSLPLDGFISYFVFLFFKEVAFPSLLLSIAISILLGFAEKKQLILFVRKKIFWFFLVLLISGWNVIVFFDHNIPVREYYFYLREGMKQNTVHTQFIQNNFVHLSLSDVKEKRKKKNLVVVFLESMENSYEDFIPEIKKIANEEISFSMDSLMGGGVETIGTSSTVSSTIAKLSGFPMLNYTYSYAQFLSNIPSVYDVLKYFGYKNVFIQGTSSNFASFGKYLQKHGVDELYDLNNISSDMIRTDISGFKYVTDKNIFQISKNVLDSLNLEQPFSLSLATIDTHSPYGYYNPDCNEKLMANSNVDIYKSILQCTSRELDSFLHWLRVKGMYENTMIVVVGDHFFKSARPIVSKKIKQRAWVNIFINTEQDKAKVGMRRYFSSVDIAPSILEGMGFELISHKMGFGVSLFSPESTLLETIGLDSLNHGYKEMKYSVEYAKMFFFEDVKSPKK
ncbi:MAG: LTA synthase family protein [Fibrobacter sp.]|nr:LTA synthase family protein [Fibrobacter sp.]